MRKMPPGRGPPPGRGGPPPGRGGPPPQGGHPYRDERVFMDQKFRRQEEPKTGFDPRGPPAQLPPPQDVFGGRGMRPEKMRQFGAAPSETSTAISDQYGHTARQPSHGGNNLPGGHPFPGAGHPHFPHDGHHGEYTGHQSPMMHHTPPRQHKSPHRPHKSPHRPGFEKYDSNDDHMDGYDSPERKNTDSKHHMSGYSDDQIPRRKSLSERILEFKHRKLTEENLEPQSPVATKQRRNTMKDSAVDAPSEDSLTSPFMPISGRSMKEQPPVDAISMSDYRQKTISKSADRPDHGSDEQDYGHEQQMKRKKSLQERIFGPLEVAGMELQNMFSSISGDYTFNHMTSTPTDNLNMTTTGTDTMNSMNFSSASEIPDEFESLEKSTSIIRKSSLKSSNVAEFKEKRKNSQVRFEDESEDMASERNNMHRDYLAILDRESAEREAAAKTAAEREAALNAAKNGAGLSPALESRTSLRGHGFERSEGHHGIERTERSSRSADRRKSSRKKSRSSDRHGRSSEPRNSYHHEEEAPKKKKKKRKSRRAKDEHYTKRSESPSFSKKVEKRRSFIKPKKKKPAELGSAELVEATVRRISRRNAPREDSNSKNFEDTRPQRRASRRNDRGNDQHEWAIHE